MEKIIIKLLISFILIGALPTDGATYNCSRPPAIPLQVCCNFDIKPNEELQQTCVEQVSSDPDSQGVGPELCIAECIFNQTIFTDGQLDMNKITQTLQEQKLRPLDISAIQKTFQICDEKLNGILTETPPDLMARRCGLYSGVLSLCIMTEISFNCPADRFRNTMDCIVTRDFLKVCPFIK